MKEGRRDRSRRRDRQLVVQAEVSVQITDVVVSEDETRFVTIRYLADDEEIIVKLDRTRSDAALSYFERAKGLLEAAAASDVTGRRRDEPSIIPASPRSLNVRSPEEDDDNPYQEPDEALPSEEQESAIESNPSRQRERFES